MSRTAALRLVKELYVLQADGGGVLGNLPDWLGNALAQILAAVPRFIGALIILAIGLFVGKAVGKVVAGVALAVGIAFGWGGHSYVADNLGRWNGSARSAASNMSSQDQGSPADDD